MNELNLSDRTRLKITKKDIEARQKELLELIEKEEDLDTLLNLQRKYNYFEYRLETIQNHLDSKILKKVKETNNFAVQRVQNTNLSIR